jgi:glycosyltransferase involved in cell wall biosynthesis
MSAERPTICLNMIVKNEAQIIRRCLDSVRPVIDYWVIVDTGSSDGTQDAIRAWFADVPGELHERPWRNFGHNRSEALELARGHGDYVLVIDADGVLRLDPSFAMPRLAADSYDAMITFGNLRYHRKQFLRNALPWRYEGVLHEYPVCADAVSEGFVPGFTVQYLTDGARSRDPNKYRRDALVLEQALLDEPGNVRNVFYLAQSYRDAGADELALLHYRRRATLGGWDDEAWHSLYQIGAIQERMGAPWSETLASYLAAWQFMPARAEPLYRVGLHYQHEKQFHLSHMFLARAVQVPRPSDRALFVEHALYDYLAKLEYAVACYWTGRHKEAIALNDTLLASGLLPADMAELVTKNRGYSAMALSPGG